MPYSHTAIKWPLTAKKQEALRYLRDFDVHPTESEVKELMSLCREKDIEDFWHGLRDRRLEEEN